MQPVLGLLEMGDLDSGRLGAAEGTGEAQQQQRPVAQPGRSSPIGATNSRSMPTFLASLSSPANVSVTTAVVVGEGKPAR